MQEFAKRGHFLFRCSSPLSRGVLELKGGGKVPTHYIAEPNSAEMLMKTIVSVLLWYFGRLCEGHNVSVNAKLNIAQNLVTYLTGHETPDLFDLASITRPRSAHNKNSLI